MLFRSSSKTHVLSPLEISAQNVMLWLVRERERKREEEQAAGAENPPAAEENAMVRVQWSVKSGASGVYGRTGEELSKDIRSVIGSGRLSTHES